MKLFSQLFFVVNNNKGLESGDAMVGKKDKRNNNNKLIYSTLQKHGKDILESERFNDCKHYVQHGNQSVFEHSVDVAKMSLRISHILPFEFKEREIVRGALLHDYFLYDWHERKTKLRKPADIKKMHGFTHPTKAMYNAERDFGLSACEKEIIRKHMWPLTSRPPMNREAWVVTLADKICSLKETVNRR
jgi:uncharacterized protein